MVVPDLSNADHQSVDVSILLNEVPLDLSFEVLGTDLVDTVDDTIQFKSDADVITLIYENVILLLRTHSLSSNVEDMKDRIIAHLESKMDAHTHLRGFYYKFQGRKVHRMRNHAQGVFHRLTSTISWKGSRIQYFFDLCHASSDQSALYRDVLGLADGDSVDGVLSNLTVQVAEMDANDSDTVTLPDPVIRLHDVKPAGSAPAPGPLNVNTGRGSHAATPTLSSHTPAVPGMGMQMAFNSSTGGAANTTPVVNGPANGIGNGMNPHNVPPSTGFRGNRAMTIPGSAYVANPPRGKRYSFGNIPGSVRKTKPDVIITVHHTQSASERYRALTSLAAARIPQHRHRNIAPLDTKDAVDRNRPLLWWKKFELRCVERHIYCPHWKGYDPTSCMGLEWEMGNLPDGIYDNHEEYKSALKADLLFVCSKDTILQEMVDSSDCGFSALHNLMKFLCKVFITRIANQSLLIWKAGVSIPSHLGNAQEFLLQSEVVGTTFSKYQQWLCCLQFLPLKIKLALTQEGNGLIRDTPGADKENTLPYDMQLQNASSFILSVMYEQGLTLPSAIASQNPTRAIINPTSGLMAVSNHRPNLRCLGCNGPHHIKNCDSYEIVRKKPSPYQPRASTPAGQPQPHRASRSDQRQVNGVSWSDQTPVDESAQDTPVVDHDVPDVSSGEDVSSPSTDHHPEEHTLVTTVNLADPSVVAEDMLGLGDIEEHVHVNDEDQFDFSGVFAAIVKDNDDNGLENDHLMDPRQRVPFCTICKRYDHWDVTCPQGQVQSSPATDME